nr:hypothetical protein [Tanacetum cinerariifolium]
MSNPSNESSDPSPFKVDVPSELPKVSLVNTSLKKLKSHLAKFNSVVKIRITALTEDNLRKLKEKAVVNEAIISHPIDLEILKVDVAPLALKLRNNMTVHSDYLKHTQEETVTLREIVEHERSLNPLNTSLDYAYNLRKLKEKAIVDEAIISHPIDLEILKVDVAPLAPKLRNNMIVHSDYLKHTQEETVTLREIVEHERSLNP